MQTPVLKEYWYIFYHALMASALGLVMQLTDVYFVSQVGEKQLAGMGLAMPFSVFVWAFLGAITGASMVGISKSFGAKLTERMKAKIFIGTILGTALAIPLYLAMRFGSDILFGIFNAETEVIGYAGDYYHIWIILVLLFPAGSMYSGTLNKINLNRQTTIIMGGSIGLNILLDYTLIFGIDGILEPMGVKGAAWATVISTTIADIFYWNALRSEGLLIYRIARKKALAMSKRLFKLAKHYAVTGIMMPTAYLSVAAAASNLPTNALAAYMVVDKMWFLYSFIMGAAGTAMGTLVTRYHGAKEIEKGHGVFVFSQKTEAVWIAALLAINFLFGKEVGGIFLKDEASKEIFQHAWYIMIVYWGLWGFQGKINTLFMSLGKPHLGTQTITARNVGFIIFPYLAAKFYGLDAFLFSLPAVAGIVLVWVMFLYYRHMKPYLLAA